MFQLTDALLGRRRCCGAYNVHIEDARGLPDKVPDAGDIGILRCETNVDLEVADLAEEV